MTVTRELYTPQTLYTLGGASFAVVAASGVIGYVFGFNPRWLGLVFALIIAFLGLSLLPQDPQGQSKRRLPLLAVAFFNGMLIYSQAVGLNTIHQTVKSPKVSEAAVIPVIDPVPWWPPAELRIAARETVEAARRVITLEEKGRRAQGSLMTVDPYRIAVEQLRLAAGQLERASSGGDSSSF